MYKEVTTKIKRRKQKMSEETSKAFKQCVLVRGNVITSSWIGDEYAVKGKKVSLRTGHKDIEGNWEWASNWEIVMIGSRLQSPQWITIKNKAYIMQMPDRLGK